MKRKWNFYSGVLLLMLSGGLSADTTDDLINSLNKAYAGKILSNQVIRKYEKNKEISWNRASQKFERRVGGGASTGGSAPKLPTRKHVTSSTFNNVDDVIAYLESKIAADPSMQADWKKLQNDLTQKTLYENNVRDNKTPWGAWIDGYVGKDKSALNKSDVVSYYESLIKYYANPSADDQDDGSGGDTGEKTYDDLNAVFDYLQWKVANDQTWKAFQKVSAKDKALYEIKRVEQEEFKNLVGKTAEDLDAAVPAFLAYIKQYVRPDVSKTQPKSWEKIYTDVYNDNERGVSDFAVVTILGYAADNNLKDAPKLEDVYDLFYGDAKNNGHSLLSVEEELRKLGEYLEGETIGDKSAVYNDQLLTDKIKKDIWEKALKEDYEIAIGEIAGQTIQDRGRALRLALSVGSQEVKYENILESDE